MTMIARGGDKMKEEGKQPNSKQSTWRNLVRKKWFYPAVYLIFAALVLTAVIWYQNRAIDLPEDTTTNNTNNDVADTITDDNDSVPVVTQEETLKMPVSNATDAEIVTKFFDYDAPKEEQEQALILVNNKYYQSVGVDIASADGKTFDVTASLSGKVTEVKEDPLLGMVVELEHENGITTKYASLEDVVVSAGEEVTQGEVLGSAGQNIYGKENGIHVHFELRKDGTPLNPEEFFNKSVSEIQVPAEKEKKSSNEEVDLQKEADDAADDAASEHDDLSRDEGDESENTDDDDDVDNGDDQDADESIDSDASSASA
jgi:stage II sporulation protein Q